jgi:hypothetical protein
MTSPLALRANRANCKDKCREQWCANGSVRAPACPIFETPRTMQTNRECNLCGNCINHAPWLVALGYVNPLQRARATARTEVAFLAMILVGVVIIQNLTMLSVWQPILDWVGGITGTTNFTVNFTLIFAVAMALPLGALALASRMSRGSDETTLRNFARFGYAIIPLDLAAHMGHNLFHLLGEGLAVPRTLAALFGSSWTPTSDALLNRHDPGVQFLCCRRQDDLRPPHRRHAGRTRPMRAGAIIPYLLLVALKLHVHHPYHRS